MANKDTIDTLKIRFLGNYLDYEYNKAYELDAVVAVKLITLGVAVVNKEENV